MASDNFGLAVRIVREVDLDKIVDGASREYFKRVMFILHKSAAEWAPVDTGHLRQSISPGGTVTSFTDTMAQVGSDLPYAKYLDDGDKTGKYHYRGGPHREQVTTGWLTDSVARTSAELDAALARVAKQIEDEWVVGHA